MHRLRCGVIYTNAFADHLAGLHAARVSGRILALEYVRAATGESWWRVEWIPEHRAPEVCRFLIGRVPVCLSRQSQNGLKHRCLDWRDGAVVVRS